MADSLANAVNDLKQQIAERVAALRDNPDWKEIQRLYTGLGVLEELCNQPKTGLAELLGIASVTEDPKIGKYDFAGMNPLEAAKKYLRMIAPRQRAASLDDILTALESGSLVANPNELRISLSRSTWDIYKVPNTENEDVYGLRENFPEQAIKARVRLVKRATQGEDSEQDQAAAEQPPENSSADRA